MNLEGGDEKLHNAVLKITNLICLNVFNVH